MSRLTRALTKAQKRISLAISSIAEAIDEEDNAELLSKAKEAISKALDYYTEAGPFFYKNDTAKDMEALHEFFDTYAKDITEDDYITPALSRINRVITMTLEEAERNSQKGIDADSESDLDISDDEDDETENPPMPTISPDAFVAKIQNYLQLVESRKVEEAKVALQEINFYFSQPNHVCGAALSAHGSVHEIQKKFASRMLRASFVNLPDNKIDEQQWQKITNGMSLLAYRFKLKMAYRRLLNGKKFKIAGLPKLVAPGKKEEKTPLKGKSLLSLPNPIKLQSKNNINKLIADLKQCDEKTTQNGLRDAEDEIFKAICKLSLRMQHATNFFFPIMNAGRFNSYTEINRRNPEYQSEFSTKGNVDILGNNGFIFFRVFVDPINNTKTRYGDTSMVFDLDLLKQGGWISLHDQLNPFPQSKNRKGNPRVQGADYATEKVIYRNNNLLRMSKAVSINAKSDKRTLDGIEYQYRKDELKSSGKRETQKSFEKRSQSFKQSFTEEIFYGPDILPGIALSVIRELRRLSGCGYRKKFLDEFKTANSAKKTQMLGKLIKDLFRIEGKYPVGLAIKKEAWQQAYKFSPIGASNYQPFQVVNPSGDGRFNSDVSINKDALTVAEAKEQERHLKGVLSQHNRQLGKLLTDSTKLDNKIREAADKIRDLEEKKRNATGKIRALEHKKRIIAREIRNLDAEIIDLGYKKNEIGVKMRNLEYAISDLKENECEVKTQLTENEDRRANLLQFYNEFKIDSGLLAKIDTPKLDLIKCKFAEKIKNKEYKPEDLLNLSTKELNDLLNHDIHQLTREAKKAGQSTGLEDDFGLLDFDDEKDASLSPSKQTDSKNAIVESQGQAIGQFGVFAVKRPNKIDNSYMLKKKALEKRCRVADGKGGIHTVRMGYK